jgi:hypothetical protein
MESFGGLALFLAEILFDDKADLDTLGFIFALAPFHSVRLAAREVFKPLGRRLGSS